MHQVVAEAAGPDHALTQRIAQFAQDGRRPRRSSVAGRRREHLEQQFVRSGAARQSVTRELVFIVLAQRAGLVRHLLDGAALRNPRLGACELPHQAVYEFQFSISWPTDVVAAPSGARLEPDRECFGKIFRGVRLRIPCSQMLNEAPAARTWSVGVWIRQRCGTESFTPGFHAPQLIGRIDGMPGLMS